MSSLGVEIGSMYFMGAYMKGNSCMALTLDDGSYLFAAHGLSQGRNTSLGTRTLGFAFNQGSFVFTNMCMFYLIPAGKFEQSAIDYYSPIPLKVDSKGYYQYDYQYKTGSYMTVEDSIMTILRQMKSQYDKTFGTLNCMTCTLPDAYYYSVFQGRAESLKRALNGIGIPRLELISERDAVLEYLKKSNEPIRQKTLIISCGEAFNSYTFVAPGRQPVTRPTPHCTGCSLLTDLMKMVVELFNIQYAGVCDPMFYKDERAFKRCVFFSTRVSMFKYLTGNHPIEVNIIQNQKNCNVKIDSKTCNSLFTAYAKNLAQHAYSSIVKYLTGEQDLSRYRVYLCGDYSQIPQLKKEIIAQFHISDPDLVSSLRPSAFAEGALYSIPPNVKVEKKSNVPVSVYPMSTCNY